MSKRHSRSQHRGYGGGMFDPQRDKTAVELDQYVPHSPEVVWRALTEPSTMASWFARPTGFSTTPGETFILEIDSDPPAEVACQVIRSEPNKRFTHSYTDLRGTPPARWIVDWRLEPHGHGTRIMLIHSGFDIDDKRQRMARNALERSWNNRLLPRLAETIAEFPA